MAYTFRALGGADVPVFKRLLEVFGDAFDERDTYQGAVPSDDYLRTLLDRPTFVAPVALDGHDVVGGLAAYVLDEFGLLHAAERPRADARRMGTA